MNRAKIAEQYFLNGFACSQAVAMAFNDVVDVDIKTLEKISLPFGGGLGRLRLTCGAISGMAMIIGALFTNDKPENKMEVYGITQQLALEFEKEYGTIICKDLLEIAHLKVEIAGKPEERNDQYYEKRPCARIVYVAADILEKYLIEMGIIKE